MGRPAPSGGRASSVLAALLLALSLTLAGCASVAESPAAVAIDTAHQEFLGNIAVVATEQVPEIKFEGFARSKGSAAAMAGGEAFFGCVGGIGHCTGDFCGAVLLLALGICGVAGLLSGALGAAEAQHKEDIVERVSRLGSVVEYRQIQQQLRGSIEQAAAAAGTIVVKVPDEEVRAAIAAGDYRSLAYRGVDTVLETTLTRVGTEGAGIDDPVAVYMQVHVRLIDTVSNEPRYATDYRYEGRRLDLGGWAASKGQPLLDELERGYRRLGAHIRDSVFDLYPFPDRSWHSAGGALSVSFGLAPVEPMTRGTLTGDTGFVGSLFEWTATDSTRPTLRWEPFPRTGDLAAAPETMARVGNVRYDLLIAREANMAPAEIVYRRENLLGPQHTVAGGLQPGNRYFWTVRARFDLDGRPRLTEWGSTHYAARANLTAPSRYSYRFRAP